MAAEVLMLGLLAFLLTYWLHSTVLLALAWLVTRRLPTAAAGLREGIWRVALFGGILTAGLQTGLGLEPPLGRWVLRHQAPAALDTAALDTLDVIGTGVVGASVAPSELRTPPAPVRSGQPDHAAAPSTRPRRAPALARVHLQERAAGGFDVARGPEPVHLELPRAAAGTVGLEAPRRRGASVSPTPRRSPAASGEPVRSRPPVREVWTAAPDSAGPVASLALDPGSSPQPRGLAWSSWIAGAWVGVAGLVIAGLIACRSRLRAGMVGRRELLDGPLAAALTRLHAGTGLRPSPRLFVAPRITVPLCTGVLRPAICIPPRALYELSAAEQEAMLAHELGHLVRRDPLWTCVTWTVQNAFFFQPLNRVARRELLATAELRADDWAAGATGERLSLASCLTRIAGWLVGEARPLLVPQMTQGGGRSHLGVRVERLLDDDELSREPRRRWLAPASCACLATLALGVPGFAAVGVRGEPELEPVAEPEPLLDVAHDEPLHTLLEFLAVEPEPEWTPAAEPEAQPEAQPKAQPDPEPIAPSPLAEAPPPEPAPWAQAGVVDPELAAELSQLDQEVAALKSELAELRGQLAGLDLEPCTQRAVSDLERRTLELADRRGRVNSVIWEAASDGIRP